MEILLNDVDPHRDRCTDHQIQEVGLPFHAPASVPAALMAVKSERRKVFAEGSS
jgi:hypothetical protein